jgi:hypothetical protein
MKTSGTRITHTSPGHAKAESPRLANGYGTRQYPNAKKSVWLTKSSELLVLGFMMV